MTEENPIQQLIESLSLFVGKELVKRFGNTKGQGLHQLFKRQFKIHYNNYSQMMPDDLAKRHGIQSLLLMAMDDVMLEVRASYSILKDAVLSVYNAILSKYFQEEAESISETANPWDSFVNWIVKNNQANYYNGYFNAIEVHKNNCDYGFDIQKCLYFDILREAGRPELCPILCEYDSMIASSVDSWIKFTRRETIASGDKQCTFRYQKRT